jgi:hypothetical protein
MLLFLIQDHNTSGLSDPREADIVRIIVEASKQELNKPIKKNEPLTADLMKLLFLKFNKVNCTLKELRLLVICALSYTRFNLSFKRPKSGCEKFLQYK